MKQSAVLAGCFLNMPTITPLSLIRLLVVCLALALTTHPGIWLAIANGYTQDSLFTLSSLEIFGLVFITGTLILLLFLACVMLSYTLCKTYSQYVARWFMILSCIVLAILLCAIALALVPQLHYLYYRLIISGLPAQWAPMGDLSMAQIKQYIFLPANASISVHASGITVWACVFASAFVAFRYDPLKYS